MMNRILRFFWTVLVFSGIYTAALGQQADTSGTAKMSRLLSISKEKAVALKTAMQYDKAEISGTINDHSLTLAQRQARLKQLIADRTNRINAVLTVEERQRLEQAIKAQVAKKRQELNGQ
jgi:hypothetical protein